MRDLETAINTLDQDISNILLYGTINALQFITRINEIGTISAGTVNISAGTINTVNEIGTLTTIGTLQAGTVDIGTIYSGSVAITAGTIESIQSGTLDIRTGTIQISGTTNVSIQDSAIYLNIDQADELGTVKVVVSEDVANGDTDLDFGTAEYGFFFPRGMRSYIQNVVGYVKNATGADQNLVAELSIDPASPPIYTTTVTVSSVQATYAWTTITIGKMWNYDSLFVNLKSVSSVYIRGATSTYGVGGTSNKDLNYNVVPILKTTLYTKPHQVSVGGVVNTISVPNSTSFSDSGSQTIPAGEEKTLIQINGSGKILYIYFWVNDLENIYIKIYADGKKLFPSDWTLYDLYVYGFGNSNSVRVLWYRKQPNEQGILEITIPYEFSREFKIAAANEDTTNHNAQAQVLSALIK